LIEQGELMVKEQQRLRDLRLVREYNQALYESRHQGQESPVFFSSPDPGVDAQVTPGAANRSDRVSESPNGVSNSVVASSSQPHTATSLAPDVAQQVQSLVAQGYPIGIEYVDPRRFNTGAWKSCNTIPTDQAGDALTQLSACLHEHQGNYVRIFGIDPAKRRVMETVVQRP
jgi:ribulose bisphosphate carboxylase small subunit